MERLTIRNSDGSVSQPTKTTFEAAMYALAAYEDIGLTPEEIMALIQPPNDPLTLEELREMDWNPIWVKRSNGVQGYYIAVNVHSGLDLYRGGCGYEGFVDYGTAWLAYRRKPEEGTA